MTPLEYLSKTIGAISLYKRLMGKGNAYAEADAKEIKALHDVGYEMAKAMEMQERQIEALMLENSALKRELYLQEVDAGTQEIRELHKMFRHSKDPSIQASLKGMIAAQVEILKLTNKHEPN